MADDLLVTVGKVVGGMVSGGAGAIPGIVDKGLELILRLTADDPVKRQKALREYELELIKIIKEAPNAEGKDLSNLTLAFIALLDGK